MNLNFRWIGGVGLLALCLIVMGCKQGDDDSAVIADGSDQPKEDVIVESPDDAMPEDPYACSDHDAICLDQGWDKAMRQDFYYTGQGSQLIPYNWFVNLALPDSDELLRSDRHLAALGFITQKPGERNPDGLPIGFVKDSNPALIMKKLKAVDYKIDLPQQNDWIGFTCAACHTANLTYEGKVLRIDGGAAMSDLESFLAALAASMRATVADDARYASFATRVQETAGGNAGAVPSKEELESYTVAMEMLVERNKAPHPYGLARLDAFGAILNQITEVALNIPENRRPSSAPVSYPFLWDTPEMDWVQWNSAAEIPIGRNVGEVLGVFGHVELTDTPEFGYASSARLDYLDLLETWLGDLKAPPWPAEHFGEIDQEKAAAGKQLFTDHCGNCHNSRDENGDFKMTPPNETGKSYIKTTSIPFNRIGTDPQMILNFATRTAKPGVLAGAVARPMQALQVKGPDGASALDRITFLRVSLGMPPPDFSKEVPAGLLLREAGNGVAKRYLGEALKNLPDEAKAEILLNLRNGHAPGKENSSPNGGTGYKARPLNGVWATAPFLHNGSVPNLWELLKPQEERVKSFYVGSREFDPRHVGLSTQEVPGSFHFQTVADGKPIPGNSNQGHSGDLQGVNLADEEKWQIIEYIKTLN
jgi:mono/diheme cytochrome c family protein